MHAAALLVVAFESVEQADDDRTMYYMMGVRDTLEAVFRATHCHDCNPDDVYSMARSLLETLPLTERVDLLAAAQRIIYARHYTSGVTSIAD